MKYELGFAAALVGAILLALGASGTVPESVFLVGGAAVGLFGLLSLGGRGSVALLLAGGWLLGSSFLPWAARQWNLLVAGTVVVALGYLVAAVGAEPEELTEPAE